ncbi:murein transglycosylase A [Undibacterium sp.]|uniref:murein transglycosylase A n=1 Tax=Undibacterium sp. TaxID=1914977 RepID=UPI002C3340C7|nr:murein transglycosylase A [Undibacterium sp.]HTD02460.1 murein transglycosylase A [Undibacterium sp.]
MFKFTSILPALAVVLVISACTTPVSLKQPAKPATPVVPPATPIPQATAKPNANFKAASFADLPGWGADDLTETWPVFMASCNAMRFKPEWKEACTIARDIDAKDGGAMRVFFESLFTPYQVINPDGSSEGLITGYYEPLLRGSRAKGGPYQTPLYRTPPDLLTIDLGSAYPELKNMRLRGRLVGNKVVPYASRAETEQALAGKELLWVDDAVEAFFLQVQGSGRVYFPDTDETVRVAYADQNGYPYKSIGRYLVDKGELTLSQASAQGIKEWIKQNPARQNELFNSNPSVVFFKEEKLADPRIGPKGAQGVPLTAQRSIAVDAQFLPLGAPVFLATTQPNSPQLLQKLVVAQDTGGAIRGAVRADYFWGFGTEAGEQAGRMKQRGQMWLLLPKSAS